ncbi:G-protein coupled receptor 35 [Chelmon rostratus]|uniref:G-protein coupled receptor 35 n=1 Tax=Chelmon rostratus TaxID=109905 RepID=UPI001BE6A189|nr:G-protein coupled receptor 35 [Chelmon rostratus]
MCGNTTNITNITTAGCRVHTLEGLAYSPVFLLGLLINAAALRAFIAKRDSWTDTHVYMLNLAIADCTLVLFLPFRIYDAFFCMPKTHLCTFLMFIHFVNMYASILTTAAISVHRYLVIRFPLQARSWRKKKEIACATCLVIWGLLVTTSVIYRDENHPNKLWTCYERCKDLPLKLQFILLLVFLGFLTPLLTVVFCSSQIIWILLKEDNKPEEKKSTVGIVTANMIVFIVCYTPIHVGFLVNFFYIVPEDWQSLYLPAHAYLLTAEWIASTNCCFDVISYYFLLRRFYS